MSIKPLERTGVPRTDPKFLPVTRAIHRLACTVAKRHDLAIRVLDNTGGAPARFEFQTSYIDVNAALVSSLDPAVVNSPRFAKRYPALYGAIVHEACHAAFSKWNLRLIHEQQGDKHLRVFVLLEEGRAESQGVRGGNLNGLHRSGLKSTILQIVLRDSDPDATQVAQARQLVGLLAARCEVGLVDRDNPKVAALLDKARDLLGSDVFDRLWAIAKAFGEVDYNAFREARDLSILHRLVREWMETEDPDDGGDGDDSDDSDDSDDGGDGGDGGNSDDGDDDGEGEGPKGDPGEGNDQPGPGQPGEGEGEEGEGDDPSDPDEGGEPNDPNDGRVTDHMGEYDSGDFGSLTDLLNEAAESVAEEVTRAEVGPAIAAENKADATSQALRRQRARDARKRWSK